MTEQEVSQEKPYKSFDKYRGAMIFAEAARKGDTATAEGALEAMSNNFVKDGFHAELYANALATADPKTVIDNFLPGYQQLHKKTIQEVANQIHGGFLKKKLGNQYEAFQADMKKYEGMTYEDLLKKHGRMSALQEMVKNGSASDEEKKEAEKLAKDYELMHLAISSAENSELQKVRNTIGDNNTDHVYESIKDAYKQKSEASE